MRGNEARLSVIIPVESNTGGLRQTIQTLRSQGVSPLEIIVVDNLCPEDLRNMLAETGVRHHRLPMNVGIPPARVEGALIATGDLLVFTGKDVWFPDQTLNRLKEIWKNELGCCVLGTCAKQSPDAHWVSQYANRRLRTEIEVLQGRHPLAFSHLVAIHRETFLDKLRQDTGGVHSPVDVDQLSLLEQAGISLVFHPELEVIRTTRYRLASWLSERFRKTVVAHRNGDPLSRSLREMMVCLGAVVFLLIGLIYPLFLPLFLVSYGLFVWINRSWYQTLLKERGMGFLLRTWWIDLPDTLAVCLGMLVSSWENRRKQL